MPLAKKNRTLQLSQKLQCYCQTNKLQTNCTITDNNQLQNCSNGI